MKTFIDQIARRVLINSSNRIVSLVPSITELLFDLGVGEQVVGITRFCKYPTGIEKGKTIIGGTKTIDIDLIHRLEPDLVLGCKEENVKQQIEALKVPVWMSDVGSLSDALAMINEIGKMTSSQTKAQEITNQIDFSDLESTQTIKVAYLIWRKPYMTVGCDTFIHNMLANVGFENVFADQKRYPVVTLEDIKDKKPDFIFLSTEPFPFKERFFNEFEAIAPPVLVDGEFFSWFGSRLCKAYPYFEQLQKEIRTR